ncbi:hypothetical protein WKK05_12070 [Nostoc sp. UHCC 0302]|uniref:hypothetical protein n=1 Tax=Nostoc sp. UHCC 0302 TaxID=3134896 RepID=UPI00311CCE25
MSNNYQFFCIDFWLPIDYESNKDGETFIFADDTFDLSIAGFSLINYCWEQQINPEIIEYENLVKNLGFPLELYGEEFNFLSKNSALTLLNKISNKYSSELTCWLQNYIYPEWKRQGLINTPCITNSSVLFKPNAEVLSLELSGTEVNGTKKR